jgi:hypothetical protein
MASINGQKFRDSARRFREMAVHGDDPTLTAALLLLADEFAREATQMDDSSVRCEERQPGQPPDLWGTPS